MHGIYTNGSKLILVLPHGPDFVVYSPGGVAVAKLKNRRSVRLEWEGGAVSTGLYNGEDCITWEGGDTGGDKSDKGGKWRLLEMSAQQYDVLTRRPYVPLTFTAAKLLMELGSRMLTAVLAMCVWKSGSFVM